MLEYTLKIDQKIVCLVLLYLFNNDISLPFFIETITPILKDKFPYSEIKITKAVNSGVSFKKFLEDFDYWMYYFDNHKILEWDEDTKKLKITSSSSEKILNLWNTEDNAEKNLRNKGKKNNGNDKAKQIKNETKEIEAKFNNIRISNEINQESKTDNLEAEPKKIRR